MRKVRKEGEEGDMQVVAARAHGHVSILYGPVRLLRKYGSHVLPCMSPPIMASTGGERSDVADGPAPSAPGAGYLGVLQRPRGGERRNGTDAIAPRPPPSHEMVEL